MSRAADQILRTDFAVATLIRERHRLVQGIEIKGEARQTLTATLTPFTRTSGATFTMTLTIFTPDRDDRPLTRVPTGSRPCPGHVLTFGQPVAT